MGAAPDDALAPQQHDRRLRGGEQPRLLVVDVAGGGRGGERREHQRERLLLAGLHLAQPAHRGIVARVDDEMKSTESLDGDDGAGRDASLGRQQRFVAIAQRPTFRVPERQVRAAGRAGIGLRVEPAVARVLVFAPARLAHLEPGHRRVRPVVRQRLDDREPRAAVRAVGEGIAVASVGWIEDLGQALWTGGDVGQDQRRLRAAGAFANLEAGEADRVEIRRLQPVDDRARRTVAGDAQQELLERGAPAFDLDDHTRRGVDDPAAQAEIRGEAIDEWPEPDALDGASDLHAEALRRRFDGNHGRDGSTRRMLPHGPTRARPRARHIID